MPEKLITRLIFILLGFIGSGVWDFENAHAQDTPTRDRQQEKFEAAEETRRGLQTGIEGEFSQELDFDYGGFFSFDLADFNDADGVHVRRNTELYLWSNLVYKDTLQAYARVKGTMRDYNAGSEYEINVTTDTGTTTRRLDEENDQNIPRLDVGYILLDLSRALGLEDYGRIELRGGRDYFKIGEGIALDRRGQGGRLEYTREGEGFSLNAFIMRTVPSEDGLDRSFPDLGHDKRLFSGVEVTQKFVPEFELFGYTLFQQFKNREVYTVFDKDPAVNGYRNQKFGQDSAYYGIGVRGEIGLDFNYSGEYILERGDRYSWSPDPLRADVKAFAYDMESSYSFRTVEYQPEISAQFTVASGDGDAGNTLDTEGGNVPGTDYNAFTNFGYVNTGLVFFPRLANINVLRAGGSCMPVKDHPVFGEVEAGINGFQYRKYKSNGGVSDRQVVPGHGFLGREVDLYTIWRPFSDLSIMTQYGYFWPASKAFLDDTRRYYFSVTLIFFF
ncbi:MAG: alginate export family protein [Planctomycetes bacterium]|nr:alginate export family protein [Planctomycetota bacterium]